MSWPTLCALTRGGDVAGRRPTGSLEADVLAFLWSRGGPTTPRDVLDGLGTDLAYTTVLTILYRLWQKGLLQREREGRAYAYSPKVTEAEYVASNMRAVLTRTQDRAEALNQFVGGLTKRDADLLRQLLEDGSSSA